MKLNAVIFKIGLNMVDINIPQNYSNLHSDWGKIISLMNLKFYLHGSILGYSKQGINFMSVKYFYQKIIL